MRTRRERRASTPARRHGATLQHPATSRRARLRAVLAGLLLALALSACGGQETADGNGAPDGAVARWDEARWDEATWR